MIITHGRPGYGPCSECGLVEELRFGACFECVTSAEEQAARRSVLQHLAHGLLRVCRLRFDFATRTDFAWAWERLTKTGDYSPGGTFEAEYFNPRPARRTSLIGPFTGSPPSAGAPLHASHRSRDTDKRPQNSSSSELQTPLSDGEGA